MYEKDSGDFEQLARLAEKHEKRWRIELHHGFIINSCKRGMEFSEGPQPAARGRSV